VALAVDVALDLELLELEGLLELVPRRLEELRVHAYRSLDAFRIIIVRGAIAAAKRALATPAKEKKAAASAR
jgi:hypothetical protein